MKKTSLKIKKATNLGLGFLLGLSSTLNSSLSYATLEVAQSALAPSAVALSHKNNLFSKYNLSSETNFISNLINGDVIPQCRGDKDDPFDFGVVIQSGPYRSECMDLSNNRPVIILNGDENSDEITVANIRYKGHFWIGKIKKNSVKKVQFELVKFGEMDIDLSKMVEAVPALEDIVIKKSQSNNKIVKAVTAHTQYRYLFSEPIQLESQVVTEDQPFKTDTLDDLTFTFNAYGVNGVGYDVEAGLSGTFGLVGKAIATVDRSVEEINWDKSDIKLVDLNWNAVVKRNKEIQSSGHKIDENKLSKEGAMFHLLLTSFRHSQSMGYRGIYHTALRNCTTEAFDLLDNAFPELLAKYGGGSNAVPFLQSYLMSKKTIAATAKAAHKSLGKPSPIEVSENEKAIGNSIAYQASSSVLAYVDNTAGLLTGAVANTNYGKPIVNSYNSVSNAVEDFGGDGKFLYLAGAVQNIEDLAYAPSIQNLKDRGLLSEKANDNQFPLLNNEYASLYNGDDANENGRVLTVQEKAEAAICSLTTTCKAYNARDGFITYPTTGKKKQVDDAKKAEQEAESKKENKVLDYK